MKIQKHIKKSKLVQTFDSPKATEEAYTRFARLSAELISYAEKNDIRCVSVTVKRDRKRNKVALVVKGIELNMLLFKPNN